MPTTERYEELRRKFDESPYSALLGLKLVDLSEGYALVEMKISPQFDNWAGMTHGGAIMSLADQAFGCALNTLDRLYVAVQFNINLLSAPKPGDTVMAEGRVTHAGRRLGAAAMIVRDSRERVIARATGTVMAIEG